MTILKLKIDNIGYEIECKKGEENLLRKAEELLNYTYTISIKEGLKKTLNWYKKSMMELV